MNLGNYKIDAAPVNESASKFAEFEDGVYNCLCVGMALEKSSFTDPKGVTTTSQKLKIIFQGEDAQGRVGTLITRAMKYSFYEKSPWYKLMSKLFHETDPVELEKKLNSVDSFKGHYFNVSVVTELSAKNGHTYANVASLARATQGHAVVPPAELPWFVKNENTIELDLLPGYTVAVREHATAPATAPVPPATAPATVTTPVNPINTAPSAGAPASSTTQVLKPAVVDEDLPF